MDGFLAKPISLDALARTLGRWIPDLVHLTATEVAPGALFDPEALRGLFGADAGRLSGVLQSFADGAARDIAAMRAAADAQQLLGFGAPGSTGAARMAGARLLAEQASRAEAAANAGDMARARIAADGMELLLSETLRAMRSVG